ncbi:MAG: OmpA family protein [Fibrobacterota bacterium]|nr:OmpA family protein [Fibrobacterota bacterium]QQS05383.1 MAG: OmpA family protein [Fibrobacterota bacterium]
MNRKFALALTAVGASMLIGACTKQEIVTPPPPPPPPPVETAVVPPPPPPPPPPRDTVAERRARLQGLMAEALKPIYFDLDQSSIKPEGKDILTKVGSLLKLYPELFVTVEGNADERGSTEYNQALGDRRAAAAKKWLESFGVKSAQLKSISYGKEKAASGQDESVWSKDRRDDLPGEIR